MDTLEDRSLTASRALALATAGFQALESRRQEINDLNVYPVPDGDTGTNLALTLKSVVSDLRTADEVADPEELARLISESALMGARGNSGVILSQIIRGAMEVIGREPELRSEIVAKALDNARSVAYRAVRKPVEGTMLTVIRCLAETAGGMMAAEDSWDGDMWDPLLEAGWKSVEGTPNLLKVLADAGVVDAGGYGLMTLIEGVVRGDTDGMPPIDTLMVPREEAREEVMSPYTYCTSFLVRGAGLDAGRLEQDLLPLGDSLLVVGDEMQVKVHVHTDEPHKALERALAQGALAEIEIDNMKEQQAERRDRLGIGTGADDKAEDRRTTDVVAVVSGDGAMDLYRSMGVELLVEGGQSMNPSAEQLLEAVGSARSRDVIVLPNNKNIVMTAEQVAERADADVRVLPSRSVLAGLSALVAFDPGRDADENFEEMRALLSDVSTGEVTRAVRDSRINGLEIQEGAHIALLCGEVVAASPDFFEVAEQLAERLVAQGAEILTVLLGDGEEGRLAEQAAARIEEKFSDVDVEVHWGGQPLYSLLMSAE